MAKDEELILNVKSNIKSVTKDTDELGKSIGNATDDNTALGTGLQVTGEKGRKGFTAIATGVKALGLALKAIGIGLIISAFVALQNALAQNQKIMNVVNTVMTTVSTTFNQVVGVLVDTYTWVTKSSQRFDGLSKVIGGLITLQLTPLKLLFYTLKLAVQSLMLAWEDSFLGGRDEEKLAKLRMDIGETQTAIEQTGLAAVKAGKNIFNNFGDAVGEIGAITGKVIEGISEVSVTANIEQAKATIAAQNSAKLAEAQIQGLIEKNDLLAEKQRQIRDDETKTFAERIEANKELGDVLDKQEIEMLKLADTRIAAAKLEADANKDNIDLQVAYIQAVNDRAGVEAQIAGFRSEQLTNEVSLNKELLESQNEIRAEGLSGLERELEELEAAYNLKLDMARKSGMETTAITKEFERQKSMVVAENAATQLAAYSQLAGALISLAGGNKELAVAQALMDTYAGANKAFAQGGTLGFVTGAAIIVQGLANVKKIMSTPVPGGGGGGAAPSVGESKGPAPQMMGGAFELTGGTKPEPVQAYVVSDDITNNQDKLAAIRRRATI